MKAIDELAKILRNYHLMSQEIRKSDIIFLLGSHDPHVARYAANLWHKWYAPYLVVSWGVMHPAGVLENDEPILEAIWLANIIMKEWVPASAIIIEPQAKNTGENCIYTKQLLEKKGIAHTTAIAVQKPYMERRTYATIKAQRPDLDIAVTSSPVSYEKYCTMIDKERFLNAMVWDLQRIKLYPAKWFQITQEIPTEVRNAFEKLVALWYTKHLVV